VTEPMPNLAQRKTTALHKLAHEKYLWFATADGSGVPHLVPLGFVWRNERMVLASASANRTVINARETGVARVALGQTDDVVMIDGRVQLVGVESIDTTVAAEYEQKYDVDPRVIPGWTYLQLTPQRIQVFRDAPETFQARTVMSDGAWRV
jgi:hypothetical protein